MAHFILNEATLSFETRHLLLRRPTNEDTLPLKKLWRDEKVREFLGGIVSDEIIDGKIIDLQNHWDLYQFGLCVVYERISNQITGLCGLHHSEDGIEISYMFFPEFWGRGLGREAVAATIDYGFKTLEIKRIIAITQEANTRSCQLLNSAGMNHIKSFTRYNAMQCLYELSK